MQGISFAALGVVAISVSRSMDQDDWGWLGLICLAGLIVAAVTIVRALRDGAKRAITDHFIVLVGAFSLYFLFGPLVLVYGPEDQTSYLLSWYPARASSAVLVTGMNLLGLGILLVSAGFVKGTSVEGAFFRIDRFLERIPANQVFWTFLFLGGTCTFYVLMIDLEGGSELISGLVRTLSLITLIAILVGAMYEDRDAGLVRAFSLGAAVALSISGLISFNKSMVLYPWLMYFFGIYLRRPSIRLIVAAVSVLMLVLIVISRPIGEARTMLDTSASHSIAGRWTILMDASAINSDLTAGDLLAGAWIRLCYAVPQVAAVELFDGGFGGDDVELAGWVLLPRVLFPQKPIITRTGTDFNAKVTSHDTSSTGIGIFVSGYYNEGWPGLIVVSIVAGVLLAFFSAASRAIIQRRSTLLLPIAMIGAYIAFRVDGYFVADFWGTFAMIMVPLLLASLVLRHSASQRPA